MPGMFFFTRDVEESPFFLAVVTIIILSTNFAFITYWSVSLYGALRQEVVWIGLLDVRLRSQYRSCCTVYCSCCTCNLANSYYRCCKKIRRCGKRHRIGGRVYEDSDEDDDNGYIVGEHIDNTVWSSMVDQNSLTRKQSLKSIHKSKSKSRQKQERRTGLQLEEIVDSHDFMIRRKKFKKETEKAEKEAKRRKKRAVAMLKRMGLEYSEADFPWEELDAELNADNDPSSHRKYHNNPLARSRWKNAARKSVVKNPTNMVEALLLIKQGKKSEAEGLVLIKKGEAFFKKRKKLKLHAGAKSTILDIAPQLTSKKSNWNKAMNKLRLVTGHNKKRDSLDTATFEMVDLEADKNNEVCFNPMHSNNKNKGGAKKDSKEVKGEVKEVEEVVKELGKEATEDGALGIGGETKSNGSVAIYRDVTTGKRYSVNNASGESTWLNDKDENVENVFKDDQDEAAVAIHRDNTSGRRYSVNLKTGESTWMDDEEPDDEAVKIYTDNTTGKRYSVNASGETKWLSAE